MMRLRVLLMALVALPSAAGIARADGCRQDKAVYRDSGNTIEMRFQPATEQAQAASHTFRIAVQSTAIVLDGVVLAGDDGQRANGLAMYKCPEGDVTGADLLKCTVWDGVFYSIDSAGMIGDLPSAAASPAPQLILSDFGRYAQNSAVWLDNKLTVAPSDVLALKGCDS